MRDLPYLFTDEQWNDPQFVEGKFDLYRANPFVWMVEQVFTVDESDKDNPVKLMPRFEYIRLILKEILENKSTVICKSRRLMATHVVSTYMLHQLIFEPYSKNGIISMTEDHAKAVIADRCAMVYNHLDRRVPFYPDLKPSKHILSDRMLNPAIESEIRAFTANPNNIRGFTMTNVFTDELAFFEGNVEKLMAALYPSIEGGKCRAILVSTPEYGTVFEEKVKKLAPGAEIKPLMNIESKIDPELQEKCKITGLMKTTNKDNENLLLLHYTAHPEKRTYEWFCKEHYGTNVEGESLPGARGITEHTWQREYELSFAVPVGKQVIPEFSIRDHCQPYSGLVPGKPMEIGLDFGSHFPSAVFCQVDSLNRLVVHGGLLPEDEELAAFMERVSAYLAQHFPEIGDNFRFFVDPAGKTRNAQGTAPPAAELLKKRFGNKVFWKTSKPVDRARAIRAIATRKRGDAMGLIVKPDAGTYIAPDGSESCGIIVEGLETGWVYKKPPEGQHYKDEAPYKDGFFDHLFDALGYAVVNLFPNLITEQVARRKGSSVPAKNKAGKLRMYKVNR
jgi:hypothetical protein